MADEDSPPSSKRAAPLVAAAAAGGESVDAKRAISIEFGMLQAEEQVRQSQHTKPFMVQNTLLQRCCRLSLYLHINRSENQSKFKTCLALLPAFDSLGLLGTALDAEAKLNAGLWNSFVWSRFQRQMRIGLPPSAHQCRPAAERSQPAEAPSMTAAELNESMQLAAYSISSTRLPEFFTGRFRVCAVRLSSCPVARRLHASLQSLAVWMIDAASAIDSDDPKWHLLLLQAEISHPGRATKYWVPVGYTTLFEFFTPTATRRHRPMSMRLAQALVLPPLHRQGHGAALLRCAHRLAEALGAYQLTVEDPADGFRRLRDAHDIALAHSRQVCGQLSAVPVSDAGLFKSYMRAFNADWASKAVGRLRVTEQQCLRAAEAHGLLALATAADVNLRQAPLNDVPASLVAAFKEWRLAVKRRTFTHDADVRAVPADIRKEHLQTTFEWDLRSYTAALQRLHGPAIASSVEKLYAATQ